MSGTVFDTKRFTELHSAAALNWGTPLTYRPETGSTNEDALLAARQGARDGSLFVAEHQTRGRGRRGRSWSSAAGQNLLFSLLLKPDAQRELNPALTLAVGLGVRAGLAPFCAEALKLKWPNDVLAGGKKLAGILCEGHLEGARAEALVIGVGINVSQIEFAPELADSAVSLALLAGHPPNTLPDRETLLVHVLGGIESRVQTCWDAGFGPLLDEFTRHDALTGQHVEVDARISGIARGVDAEGQLLIESEGQLVRIHSGTVRNTRAGSTIS